MYTKIGEYGAEGANYSVETVTVETIQALTLRALPQLKRPPMLGVSLLCEKLRGLETLRRGSTDYGLRGSTTTTNAKIQSHFG